MKLTKLSKALGIVLLLTVTPINADAATKFPYTTTIAQGDFAAATIRYGDQAQAGTPGLDAIPMFPDLKSYAFYYKFADDKECDVRCVRSAYSVLRKSGAIELVPVGTSVQVLGEIPDPADSHYTICRVRLAGRSRTQFVLSAALKD